MGSQGCIRTLALGVTLERAPPVSASNATQICNWAWRQTQQMEKSYLPKIIAENNTSRKFEIQQTLKQHTMPPPLSRLFHSRFHFLIGNVHGSSILNHTQPDFKITKHKRRFIESQEDIVSMLAFCFSQFSGLCRGGKGVKSETLWREEKERCEWPSYVRAEKVRKRRVRRWVLLRYSTPYKYGSQEENSL